MAYERHPRDLAGGPGWVIDGTTLQPRILDVPEFRRGLADDALATAVEEFALALRLREEAGADDGLLRSSRYALEVARDAMKVLSETFQAPDRRRPDPSVRSPNTP